MRIKDRKNDKVTKLNPNSIIEYKDGGFIEIKEPDGKVHLYSLINYDITYYKKNATKILLSFF